MRHCRESGMTLLETLVALAVLATIAVVFLTGLAIIARAAFMADEQATAEGLAQSQMEWAQNADYVDGATQYSLAQIPSTGDYVNYSAAITAQPLQQPDGGIQKITVTVERSGKRLITLEGYKTQR